MNSKPFLEEETLLKNKWMILEHIASGGKGEIYLARQKNLQRQVAVKIISRSFLESLASDENELDSEIERFRREVLIMSNLKHPNILQIYDFDEEEIKNERIEFIVMEYIQGTTLKRTISEEGMETQDDIAEWIRKYFIPVLNGIEVIHDAGIVHRDLKPDNILLDGDIPKITDFGLAGGRWFSNVTKSHHIAGTMPYMPEEQFLDLETTDSRADIYALGKILYEAVQGKMKKETGFVMNTAHLEKTDTPFLKQLDRIIREATDKNRNFRTAEVKILRTDLENIVRNYEAKKYSGKKEKSSSKKWVYSSFIFLILFLVVTFVHLRMDDTAPNILKQEKKGIDSTDPAAISEKGEKFLKASDGATLVQIKPGKITHIDPDTKEKAVKEVSAFYIEKIEVTNHQYAEFLNKNLKQIRVIDNVVYGNKNNIWLILGEADPGYEPLVFKNERFFITDPALAANPVIRVTPRGALAYADFFGRSLPSPVQWHLAASEKSNLKEGSEEAFFSSIGSSAEESGNNKGIFPVSSSKSNSLGVKGLYENAGEWVLKKDDQVEGARFYILGRKRDDNTAFLSPEPRKPWEAFRDVGFRTVKKFE